MYHQCKSINCSRQALLDTDFCDLCEKEHSNDLVTRAEEGTPLSKRYPHYYKDVGDLTEIDVYAVHHLFDIQDPSGCIQHSSKKLLLAGVRTGGKSPYKDIKEARDTLTRWLQLNEPKPMSLI